MIIKIADAVHDASLRAQAGSRAEQDMAFYLRRAFGSHRADVFVFNDIRIVHEGEVAQIDHLVLHTFGVFVIESKSVSGEVHIAQSGQFVRIFGRRRVGMPSPVQQAKRQAELLRRLLIANKSELRNRAVFGLIQGGFQHCPIETRVAISDRGIITGEKYAPEVRKADQICEDIEARMSAHKRGRSLLSAPSKSSDGDYKFAPDEIGRLCSFLLARHTPLPQRTTVTEPEPSGSSAPAPTHRQKPAALVCAKCGSAKLRILSGTFGHYFKCGACQGNTAVNLRIEGFEQLGRLRRVGREFYLVHPDGSEQVIFVNPD